MSHKSESSLFFCKLLAKSITAIDLENILRSVGATVRNVRDPEGKAWLCAKDVCSVLTIAWGGSTLSGLPADGRKRIPTPTASGTQSLVFIDARLFFCLVFRSDKAPARKIAKAIRSRLPAAGLKSAQPSTLSNFSRDHHGYN